MAQQGEFPVNPPIPPPIQMHPPFPPPQFWSPLQPPQSLPQIHPSKYILSLFQPQAQTQFSSTSKRRRDDVDASAAGDTGESAAKRAKPQDVIFRIVVPSRQIGKVIGKGGHRVQKVREETKAAIKIADAILRHEERVIIISSNESENNVTKAENALQQIANLILKEDDTSAEVVKEGVAGQGHVAANTLRLLIAGSQAGCLIGMSGQNIEKLRTSSGASVTVLAPNQLPLCASAYESDRVVQISGEVPAVMKAIVEIGRQLRENPPREVIPISPAYNYSFIQAAQPQVDPSSADYVTSEMMIAEALVGGLIGRGGSNISRIRIESGATIKVYGGKGQQTHRHIQLGGSSQQVALAKQRVDEYIYSQSLQQAGSQQPGFLGLCM